MGVTRLFILWEIAQIDLAVLRCLDTSKTWIGKQLPAGVNRFFDVQRSHEKSPSSGALSFTAFISFSSSHCSARLKKRRSLSRLRH